jgi:hypothetical protein
MEVTHLTILTTTDDDGNEAAVFTASILDDTGYTSRSSELSNEQLNALSAILFAKVPK